MKAHEASEIFPLLEGDEFQAFCDDVRVNGLLDPIVRLKGKILDGRNRQRACEETGTEPCYVEWDGRGGSPTQFVLSENMQRRHLTKSQRAMLAVDVLPLLEAEAAQRRKKTQGRPKKTEHNNMLSFSEHKAADAAAKAAGCSQCYVENAKALAEAAPDLADDVRHGRKTLTAAKREVKKREAVEKLKAIEATEANPTEGVFDVVIVDPPWPVKKIERDCRPNQTEQLDYPTMTVDEIKALEIPAAENCHLWLWTTHKYLPAALGVLQTWKAKYVCAFVWHKPGGFQPVGLPQLNCEFVLYARKGTPPFIDTKAFPVCFDAPRGKHSEKPEAFYDMIRRCTGGRRLDMFNRREIEGFNAWGKEAP